MKPWLRFFLGAALALVGAAVARAQVTPSGLSVAPGSALPGDTVTFTVTVSNAGGAIAASTADFSIVLTNTVTGATFTVPGLAVPSVGQITAAAVGPPPTPGTGTFQITAVIPAQTTQSGNYRASVTMKNGLPQPAMGAGGFFSVSSSILTITGQPDFQITSLSYPAGTSYVGGDVIPMTLTFRNNIATNGKFNVPYVPGVNGFPTFFRIQVVLSNNPTFGDSDDFVLYFFDVSAGALATMSGNNGLTYMNADGADRTFSWNQLLPGNFSGSYYVLAKINSLPTASAVSENDPPVQTVNGNNVWAGNSMNPNATLINLLPSNFPTTNLVSHAAAATTTANNYSDNPSMTADGRYVAFASDATNLVAADTNNARDIFLFDSQTNTTRLLSKSVQGVQGNGASNNPAISSADGRWVAFASDATNLVFGDTNGFSDIFAVDSLNGEISRVSVTSAGDQANNPSFKPAISQDGRYVAFESTATNLVPGVVRAITFTGGAGYLTVPTVAITGGNATTNATAVANIANGAVSSITITSGGAGYDGTAVTVTLTGGGFTTAATATAFVTPVVIVPFGSSHIYLHNRDVAGTGNFDTMGNTETVLVDLTPGGAPANGSGIQAALSADGSHVAFASIATDLVASAINIGVQHVYERPTGLPVLSNVAGIAALGATVRVSVQTNTTTEGDGNSQTPSLSAKGEYVAFASLADDLLGVGNDTNGVSDIFVYDNTGTATNGKVTRVSAPDPSTAQVPLQGADPMGTGFKLGSINPTISADGRYVAFASLDNNLTAGTPGAYVSGGIGASPPTATVNAAGSITSLALAAPNLGGAGYTKIAPVVFINAVGSGATATAVINAAGQVTGLNLSNGGSDYLVPPKVIITGGGATTVATATATVAGGAVTAAGFTITAAGAGYTSQPVVTITSGDNAQAVATMEVTIGGGFVTNGGAGYTSAPTVTLTSINGLGSGATATATIDAVGKVVSGITITGKGSGYTSAPVVSISGGGGTGATAIVSMSVNAVTVPGSGATALAAIGGGAVLSIAVTAGGSGYLLNPSVVITGGGGAATGASAVATVFNGIVTGITVTNGGSGYTVVPSVTITNGGANYTSQPIVTIDAGGDANSALDIFVHDRNTAGANGTLDVDVATTMVSVNRWGYQTGALLGIPSTAASNIYPVLSADGRYVAFPSDAENTAGLAFGANNGAVLDNNGFRDLFIHDRRTNTISPGNGNTPSVTITTPGTGSSVFVNTATTISASAVAVVGVVANVQFYVNGAAQGAPIAVFPYTTTWTPTAVGTYTLSAVVTDSFGNQGISPNITVNCIAQPSVGISVPVTQMTLGGAPQTITATASATSPGATITSVKFTAAGPAGPLPGGLFTFTKATPPYTTTFTPTAVGTYTLTATATDTNNAQGQSPVVTVIVSPVGGGGGGTPPTVSLAPVPPLTSPVNVPITLTATAAAAAGATITSVEFLVNGSIQSTVTSAPYTFTFTPASGANVLTVVAIDNLGNSGSSTPVTLTVNGAAPTVAFGHPVPAGLLVNIPYSLTATASPASGNTVTQVQYFANGVLLGTATAFPYLFSWTPLATGGYTVTAVATDNNGNKSVAATATVTVNSGTVPAIPLTSPINGASYAVGNPITVAATAALGSGLFVGVEFFANGVSLGSVKVAPFSVTFTPNAPGTYVFTALGTDSSGNTVTTTPVTVSVVVPTGPTVAISSPANNASLPVNVPQTVTVIAGSSSASLTSVDVTANGVSLGPKNSFPYVFSWTPASEGTFVLIAVATDSQGTVSRSIPITVKVAAAAPPTVSLTSPLAGSSYPVGNPVTLTANASSPAAGITIASVQFFDNGASLGTKTSSPYTLTWLPTVAGSYSLSAIATDTSGAQATSAPVAVTIGLNAPPTISLTSPSSAATYALGSGVLLSATAGDSDGTVTSVQFFANGLLLSTVTKAPYSFSWVPQASGTYQVTASATDNTGNVSTTPQLPVTISAAVTTTVSITNPLAASSYPVGNAIPFVATIAGGNGPITLVEFFVNGTSIGTKPGWPSRPIAPAFRPIHPPWPSPSNPMRRPLSPSPAPPAIRRSLPARRSTSRQLRPIPMARSCRSLSSSTATSSAPPPRRRLPRHGRPPRRVPTPLSPRPPTTPATSRTRPR